MLEQLNDSERQFSAWEYQDLGGRWDSRTFDKLMDIVDERETNPIQIKRVCIDQVQGMGRFTGLKITPEEEYLYGVLYQYPIEKTLGQQQLLAEVMLVLGNPQKREDFMLIYPNIDFNSSVLQREAIRPQREKVFPRSLNTEVLIFAYGQ